MTLCYAALALMAFAANSVLCRLALRDTMVDPATFTTIRLTAGAAMLLLITPRARSGEALATGSWTSAAILALYAIPFSFAYTSLSAGTGALILFGSVQLTMLIAAVWSGERPRAGEWLGLGLAVAGLVSLVRPGLAAPPLTAAALMGVAGFSWGVYSLRGRAALNPLLQTTSNFVRSIPFTLVISLIMVGRFEADARGVWLAVASGSLASGLGYVIWYAALRGLTAVRAAVAQLAVPVLTAVSGVVFLSETVTTRLVLSAVMVLGGIALAIGARQRLSVSPELSATR